MTVRRLSFLLVTTGLMMTLSGDVVHACPVCFRFDESRTTTGAVAAVLVLMGVTTGVLGGFAAFGIRFVRRAARSRDSQPDTTP